MGSGSILSGWLMYSLSKWHHEDASWYVELQTRINAHKPIHPVDPLKRLIQSHPFIAEILKPVRHVRPTSSRNLELKSAHHEGGGQAGYPWTGWWHAWHEWRKGWYPRRGRRGKLRRIPEVHRWQSSGNEDPTWSLERSHERDAGRGVCGWATQ